MLLSVLLIITMLCLESAQSISERYPNFVLRPFRGLPKLPAVPFHEIVQ
jgi:hypothetical protein